MTKGLAWIEYKVGVRFCDTGAGSNLAGRAAVTTSLQCDVLVQIRAFIA
jgi:hypothetical protein